MDKFIGFKEIKARPMNRGDYNVYRGWKCPADENPDDDGFLVEYIDGGQANHPDHTGYISWSPKGVFERAYRRVDGLTFGQAIEAMKAGKKVARAGWNGKGMHLYLVEKFTKEWNDRPTWVYDPFIMMVTVTGSFVPWLASQTDMLSEDWMVVE